MLFQIQVAAKLESMYRTAFIEQVRAYDPSYVALVVGPEDLVDPDGPIALTNLPFDSYNLKLLNAIRYVDGTQLYPVPGTTGTDLPVVVNTVGFREETAVAKAGKSD